MAANEAAQTQQRLTVSREEALRSKQGYWIGRRAQDIVLSALALVALSPLMLVVALLRSGCHGFCNL